MLLHKQSVLGNLLGMENTIQLLKLVQARIAKDGCTGDLNLTPKPADAVTTQTICSGESFSEWHYTTTQLVQESAKRMYC
jgi:hypothetical protein